MHLPEFTLVASRDRRVRGGRRLRVHGQRIMLEHDLHVVGILLDQLFHRGRATRAEGALKVRELNDGHKRRLFAQNGAIAHRKARRVIANIAGRGDCGRAGLPGGIAGGVIIIADEKSAAKSEDCYRDDHQQAHGRVFCVFLSHDLKFPFKDVQPLAIEKSSDLTQTTYSQYSLTSSLIRHRFSPATQPAHTPQGRHKPIDSSFRAWLYPEAGAGRKRSESCARYPERPGDVSTQMDLG